VVAVLLVLVAAAVVVAALAVATGRWPVDPLAEPIRSTPDHGLPDDPRARDIDELRFDTAARGYRMEEVNNRLAVLRVQLADRERRVAALGERTGPSADPAPSATEDTEPPPAEED
jgi:hypothetical protein